MGRCHDNNCNTSIIKLIHHGPSIKKSLLFLLINFIASICSSNGLRHNFFTKDDERSLIGPIGFPFGFLDNGYCNITVFDFELTEGVHDVDEKIYNGDDIGIRRSLAAEIGANDVVDGMIQDQSRRLGNEILQGIDAVGFLLKRFESESKFAQYMNVLQQDSSNCAFDPFLHPGEEDDDYPLPPQDDDTYSDVGDFVDVYERGIFLDMKKPKNWKPNKPFLSYEFKTGEAGLYFLIFQICPAPTDRDIHTQFELDFHFINYDMFGNPSYLPAGEMILPHMFFYFSLLYAICIYLWVTNISMIQQGGEGHFSNPGTSHPIVYPIHHLMSILLILKTCSIFFESIRYHYIRVSGHAELWSFVYYFFAFIKGTFLFTVILLIGSGWSFVKPFLSDREKNMIYAVLMLQVINNIAIIVLTQETEGEHSFDRWTAVLHMVDILCCCAVLIPIVWQVNALEKNMEQANSKNDTNYDNNGENYDNDDDDDDDGRVPEDELEQDRDHDDDDDKVNDGRLLTKLRLFRSFYLLVVTYIYVTRIVVYLFATMLDYRHIWLKSFVVESVTLAFYVMVGMQFRPMGENPYLTIRSRGDEDEEDSVPFVGRSPARVEMTVL